MSLSLLQKIKDRKQKKLATLCANVDKTKIGCDTFNIKYAYIHTYIHMYTFTELLFH